MSRKILFTLLAVLFLATGASAANREIYPVPAQAKPDLEAALRMAPTVHKRILLDFGGNWCGDCQVLDIYLHDPANHKLLTDNFVLVHVNIGHMDANLDIAQKYGIPLNKGVPAVAVLNEDGNLLYSQQDGQFEAMRRMDISSVTQFLDKWKPAHTGCKTTLVNC